MLLERFDLPAITHKIGTVGGPPNGPSHLRSCRRAAEEIKTKRRARVAAIKARGTERLMTGEDLRCALCGESST
jgi:hypothetical protein